jgi:AcrR family transcriptional regulator
MTDSESRPGSARRLRSDAERSIEAILDAALSCIQSDVDLTMSAVARKADVSRVTLYAHFPTRQALVEALVRRTVATSKPMVEAADIHAGSASDALARLLDSAWDVLSGFRRLHAVAASVTVPARLRELHEPLFGPLDDLVARGQAEGDFNVDLPRDWLVATILDLLHLCAEEVDAGRLRHDEAGHVVTATLLGALGCSHLAPHTGAHVRRSTSRDPDA